MQQFMKLTQQLSDLMFDENPAVHDLLTIIIFFTIFWSIFFTVFTKIIGDLLKDEEWFIKAAINEFRRNGKDEAESFGITQTEEEGVQWFKQQWPWSQCVFFQHLAGGALCLPSMLGIFDESTASSLACLGILSEIGWEVQDLCTWVYRRYALPNGKKAVPFVVIVVVGLHHSLSMVVGIPAILHYRHLKVLHALCFDLQGASAVALWVQEYTKLLDVSKPNELRRFQNMTIFSFCNMVVARVFVWFYLIFQFAMVWYEEAAWKFMFIGLIMATLFTLFSVVALIIPCYKRILKFQKLAAEYEAIPSTHIAKRRSSAIELQSVADNVLQRQEDEIVNIVLDEKLFGPRRRRSRIQRRETLPPSLTSSPDTKSAMVTHNIRASLPNLNTELRQLLLEHCKQINLFEK